MGVHLVCTTLATRRYNDATIQRRQLTKVTAVHSI